MHCVQCLPINTLTHVNMHTHCLMVRFSILKVGYYHMDGMECFSHSIACLRFFQNQHCHELNIPVASICINMPRGINMHVLCISTWACMLIRRDIGHNALLTPSFCLLVQELYAKMGATNCNKTKLSWCCILNMSWMTDKKSQRIVWRESLENSLSMALPDCLYKIYMFYEGPLFIGYVYMPTKHCNFD